MPNGCIYAFKYTIYSLQYASIHLGDFVMLQFVRMSLSCLSKTGHRVFGGYFWCVVFSNIRCALHTFLDKL